MAKAEQSAGNVVVEADGAIGRTGSKEASARNGQFNGAAGERGNAARAPTGGIDAGEVELDLRSDADAVVVKASSSHLGEHDKLRTEISLSAIDVVKVNTRGGRGGDGGVGGHGGHGAQGRRGRNATRYSSGGNGGRGGDGGDGGKGTHGAPGGSGGKIVINVDDKDTFLLMAVQGAEHPSPLVVGGDGGQRGKHGAGGGGGAGGSGGSSYSWTESHSSTDSQGNSTTSTTYHSNPGGRRGPRGSDGYTPRSPLVPGRDGENGDFKIVVKDGPSTFLYPRRYDLNLSAFDIDEPDDLDNDGIIEFGERIRTKNFHYENVGGMPLPKLQRVRLQLQAGDLVKPRTEEAFLPRPLGVREACVVDEDLHFDVSDPEITKPGDPLVWREEVVPQAWQLGDEFDGTRKRETLGVDSDFQRRYDNVRFSRTIVARFPLRNTAGARILRSLAPGEGTRLEFTFENISRVSLGHEADRKRRVAIQLWLSPDAQVQPRQLSFFNEDGEEFGFAPAGQEFERDGHDDASNDREGENTAASTLDRTRSGWVCEIPLLQAQSGGHVRGSIWIAEDVEPWSAVTFRASLLLDRLSRMTSSSKELRCVQQREFTVRAEPGYDWTAHNRVLLLAHDGVSREAWRAWHEVLEEDFGLGTDDWSLTRYGHIDFDADPGDGTSLRAHLQDRMVVVLNHPFHPTGDEVTQLPSDYLQAKDFRTAAVAEGTRAYVVGDPKFELQEWLAPVRDVRADGIDADSLAALLKKEKTTADRIVQEEFKEDPTIRWDTAKVLAMPFYFFKPDVDAMRKRTQKFLKRLEQIHPGRRYVIVERPHAEPEKVGHSWWFGLPLYELGSVEVRRTLDDDRAFSVVQPASEEQAGSAAFIGGQANRFAIALSLPFTEKLASLDRVLNRVGDSSLLADAHRMDAQASRLDINANVESNDISHVDNRENITDDLDARALATASGLVRAILLDVIEEFEALKRRKAKLTDDVLKKNLVALERLSAFPFRTSFGGAKSNRYGPLLDLWAGFYAYLESQKRWWRLFGRKRKIRVHGQDKLEQLKMNLFNASSLDHAGDLTVNPASFEPRMLAMAEPLLAKIETFVDTQFHGDDDKLGDRAAAHLFRQYLRDGGVTRDMDLFQSLEERIWTESDLLRAQAREHHREQAQDALRARNASERTALLLTHDAAGRAVAAGEWSAADRAHQLEQAEAVDVVDAVHEVAR